MTWKVGNLCVVKHFGQWFNSKIRELNINLATVEFGSNDVADIIDGDNAAVNVPISILKPFGPFAVNKKGELTISGSNQPYHGEWKGKVELNGFKTNMLFATGSGSNFIPEDEVKTILPNYKDCLKLSTAELYWQILGENIGEVNLDVKCGNRKVAIRIVREARACGLWLSSMPMPLVIGGAKLVMDEFQLIQLNLSGSKPQ